jgi:hypothetical protein
MTTSVREINAAYRVGYIASLGLRAASLSDVSTPFADIHTSWANYVPAWVDEAKLEDHWRQGFRDGLSADEVLAEIKIGVLP